MWRAQFVVSVPHPLVSVPRHAAGTAQPVHWNWTLPGASPVDRCPRQLPDTGVARSLRRSSPAVESLHVAPATCNVHVKGKSKSFPHSLPSVGPRADPGVQAVSLQVTISHPPGGKLQLISARPAVTFPAAEHLRPLAGTKLYCLVTEAHRCEQIAQGCYTAFAPSRIWTHDLLIASPTFDPFHLISIAILMAKHNYVSQSSLLSGQNVCWPHHVLPPGESRCMPIGHTERQTDIHVASTINI